MVTITKEKKQDPVHTCHYCGHTGTDVNLVCHVHIGGRGDVEYYICDDILACITRVKEEVNYDKRKMQSS